VSSRIQGSSEMQQELGKCHERMLVLRTMIVLQIRHGVPFGLPKKCERFKLRVGAIVLASSAVKAP